MFIDGNHDIEPAYNDVKMYLPLLNDNGFCVLDDTGWSSLQKACNYAKQNLKLIYEEAEYCILQKSDSTDNGLNLIIQEILK